MKTFTCPTPACRAEIREEKPIAKQQEAEGNLSFPLNYHLRLVCLMLLP